MKFCGRGLRWTAEKKEKVGEEEGEEERGKRKKRRKCFLKVTNKKEIYKMPEKEFKIMILKNLNNVQNNSDIKLNEMGRGGKDPNEKF